MKEEIACNELVELVTEYLEGTLPGAIREQFELHLSECDGCSNYLAQIRQTILLTGRIREESLSSQQRDELMNLFSGWKKV